MSVWRRCTSKFFWDKLLSLTSEPVAGIIRANAEKRSWHPMNAWKVSMMNGFFWTLSCKHHQTSDRTGEVRKSAVVTELLRWTQISKCQEKGSGWANQTKSRPPQTIGCQSSMGPSTFRCRQLTPASSSSKPMRRTSDSKVGSKANGSLIKISA